MAHNAYITLAPELLGHITISVDSATTRRILSHNTSSHWEGARTITNSRQSIQHRRLLTLLKMDINI